MRVYRKWQLSLDASALDELRPAGRGEWGASLANKHEGRLGFTFQDPQRPQFIAQQWMGAAGAALGSAQMKTA
jgi:hypothetical protein